MFIYWGKSTFSTSFISFKNVCINAGFGLKNTKFSWGEGRGNNLPSGPRHFHLGYCFLIWASSLKISVAQLAIMHKKLIWDPGLKMITYG